MEYDLEYIKNLVFEKLSDTIQPDDERLLQSLISKPGPAQDLWTEVSSFYNRDEARIFLSSVNTADEWRMTEKRIKRKTQKTKMLRLLVPSAVAASAVTAVLLLKVFSTPQADQGLANKPAIYTKQAITFQVDDAPAITINDSLQQTIAAGGGTTLTANGKSLTYNAGSGKWARIFVPAGKDYKIQLSDKSELWINSATTVRFPMTFSGNREIEVSGEAYLKVSANAKNPFIVHLPGADVEVLGTEFNLNSYDSAQVRVALVDGKVNLNAAAGKISLKPGQQGSVINGNAPSAGTFDKEEVLSWMKGQYNFHNIPLSQIAAILERCYGLAVVIKNDSVAKKRFTGVIDKTQSITDFLERLSSGMEVSYTFRDGVVYMN